MRAITFHISYLFLCILQMNSQTSVFQGFEASGSDTWSYTGGSINTETKKTGSNSLRLGRSDVATSCGAPTDDYSILFSPLSLNGSACLGVFSFNHSVRASSGSGCGAEWIRAKGLLFMFL